MIKKVSRFSTVLGAAVLVLFLGAPVWAQDLLLTNAQLVDPAAETVHRGALLIQGGRVVGPVDGKPEGFAGTVVDAGGRFVIPGLFDTHVHSFGNAAPDGKMEVLLTPGAAKRALYVGVVGFLDLFSMEDVILEMRDSQRVGKGYPGARIFASGPCLTATKGHCSEYGIPTRIIDTPADARKQVSELATKKPDVVKIVYDHESYGGHSMPSIDRPTLEAAIATAKENGLATVIHIGHWQDVRDAVMAGATAVTHTPRGPMPADLPALMREKGTLIIPTLAVQTELADLIADPSPLEDPLAKAVAAEHILASYRSPDGLSDRFKGWLVWQRGMRSEILRSVGTLAKAGVVVLAGTDAGNVGLIQGWSLHRELEKLVEAGLTPWQALRSASVDVGKLLDERWGLAAGDRGDLVVLEASPIADIRNTRKIHMVIQGGRIVDREALLAE
jgi:imidazolonepropionase-like amidohydrolase